MVLKGVHCDNGLVGETRRKSLVRSCLSVVLEDIDSDHGFGKGAQM